MYALGTGAGFFDISDCPEHRYLFAARSRSHMSHRNKLQQLSKHPPPPDLDSEEDYFECASMPISTWLRSNNATPSNIPKK